MGIHKKWTKRTRRGIAGTAVAAAVMAALTASQAPGLTGGEAPEPQASTPPPGPAIDGGGNGYRTELPPLDPPTSSASDPSAGGTVGGGGNDIPDVVLAAYTQAEASLALSNPGCNLKWQMLAAIGKVESGHAWGETNVRSDGTTIKRILGPLLDGGGFATVKDTDNGEYDGNVTYDSAVGPMQFIPSTWADWAADGNGDGRKDPNNVFDAALAAGRYLCADGRDLSQEEDLDRAILGYNHSQDYLHTVRSWYQYYLTGHYTVPNIPGVSEPAAGPGGNSKSPSAKSRPSGSASPSGTSAGGTIKPKPTTTTATGSVHPTPTGSTTSPTPTDTCPTPSQTPTETPTDGASGTPSPTPTDGCPSASPSPSVTGSSPTPTPTGTTQSAG